MGLLTLARVALVFLALLTSAWGQEATPAPEKATRRPFLWQIEGETPSFLFGTIHLPLEEVLDLPPVVEAALAACDQLENELPMDERSRAKLLPMVLLPDGKKLAKILPPDLHARLTASFRERGGELAGFERYQIWTLPGRITMLDYADEFKARLPLDDYLHERARKLKMKTGALETQKEQVDAFQTLDTEEQIEMLRKALDHADECRKKEKRVDDDMVAAYLTGDLDKVIAVMRSGLQLADELRAKLERALLTTRNERMAERIAERIAKHKKRSFFFAVGAAHMAGEQGLIALLQARGLKVRRLENEDAAGLAEDR